MKMAIRREEIKDRLNVVFQEVFDDNKIQIFDDMTAKDIPEWDSLMHITLVLSVESEFGVELNAADVGKLLNVGIMIDYLISRATK